MKDMEKVIEQLETDTANMAVTPQEIVYLPNRSRVNLTYSFCISGSWKNISRLPELPYLSKKANFSRYNNPGSLS